MFYTYVLKSVNHEYHYKGHCENINRRLKEHNSGLTKSIKKFRSFILVYFDEFSTREEAVKREKYFKSVAGRLFLKHKIVELNNTKE